MGYPLRLHDGSTAILELRPGAKLTDEEAEALRYYVEFLRDRSSVIKLAREKLTGPPVFSLKLPSTPE